MGIGSNFHGPKALGGTRTPEVRVAGRPGGERRVGPAAPRPGPAAHSTLGGGCAGAEQGTAGLGLHVERSAWLLSLFG